ncbi:hypothetical protein CMV_024185, partial [Castanea mollissima]
GGGGKKLKRGSANADALHRSQLNNAILEGGIPFNRTYGTHAFKYPDLDPRFNKVFNAAILFNHTTIVIKKILESYKGFEQLRQLVDVGGGLGVTVNLITTRYPNMKGINFDLPHVIQHAPPYPGEEHIEGDMLENVLEWHAIFFKEERKGPKKKSWPWQPWLDLVASNLNVLGPILQLKPKKQQCFLLILQPHSTAELENVEPLKDSENKAGKRKRQSDQVGEQSMEMLKVRAALKERLKQEGILSSRASKSDKAQKRLKPVNG